MTSACTIQLYSDRVWRDVGSVRLLGAENAGWRAKTYSGYGVEWAVEHSGVRDAHALCSQWPVGLEPWEREHWPVFLIDMLPQGFGRQELLHRIGQEWDQYLRSDSPSGTIAGFMSSKALGATQKASREGVALLTVHSSKGLEFDVVFVAGMAEGSFPDYRSTSGRELLEEQRNAFVAVTRSKRLLYLTYPKARMMPWGSLRRQAPSRFIRQMGLGD